MPGLLFCQRNGAEQRTTKLRPETEPALYLRRLSFTSRLLYLSEFALLK
jgi:hypothetical protein